MMQYVPSPPPPTSYQIPLNTLAGNQPNQIPISVPTSVPTPIETFSYPATTSPYTTEIVTPPPTVITSTIPIDCQRESNDYWDCFEPSFSEGKGKTCRTDCMRECALWIGHSRGILAEIQEAMHDVIRVYPFSVSSLNGPNSSPPAELQETQGVLPHSSPPSYLYSPQSFPSGLKSAFFEILIPYIYLAIETPGDFLRYNGVRDKYYISHYITPIRVNDETRWKIEPTLGEDGRPLVGRSSSNTYVRTNTGSLTTLNIENPQSLFDLNSAAKEICNIMGTSNLQTLIVNLEVPESTLSQVFSSPIESQVWWNIFKGKVRIFKGRTAWFPPSSAGGYGDVTDKFFYFSSSEGKNSRPWRWQLKLSLRHLLLFYLIKTQPGGSPLTKLEQRNYSYSVLPKAVRDFFSNWSYSH